jgi:hypothetical protein
MNTQQLNAVLAARGPNELDVDDLDVEDLLAHPEG